MPPAAILPDPDVARAKTTMATMDRAVWRVITALA
jgi:hypothetical protein